MTPIQLLFATIAIIAFLNVLLQFYKDRITTGQFLFWSFSWFVLFLISFTIDRLSYLTTMVGIGRPVDLVIYVSIIVLFVVVYILNMRIESLNKQLTTLVRDQSIKHAKKK